MDHQPRGIALVQAVGQVAADPAGRARDENAPPGGQFGRDNAVFVGPHCLGDRGLSLGKRLARGGNCRVNLI